MQDFYVLLINPPAKKKREQYDRANFPNPALAYLAAYLTNHGIMCRIIDAKLSRMTAEDIINSKEVGGAGIIGITSMTHEMNMAAELAVGIKKAYKNKKIVIGGPHATALPYESLKSYAAFDYLVYGEGERPLLNLARSLQYGYPWHKIKGLCYRIDGQILAKEEEDVIEDVNELPPPAYELFPKSERYFVLTSRGCVYRCPFCYNKRSKIRFRNAENIAKDLTALIEKYSPKTVTISDDTFNADRKRTVAILDFMIKGKLGRKTEFKATLHPKNLDYYLLKQMKEAGFRIIHLGIESGNQGILNSIAKETNKEMIRKVVYDAKRARIGVQGLYILGHPNETWKTAFDTVKFAIHLNTEEIALALMVPYPGTMIWQAAKDNLWGYRNLACDWERYSKYFYPAMELEHLNKLQLVILQTVGYLGLYLCNLRFISGFKYAFSFRREIFYFFSARVMDLFLK